MVIGIFICILEKNPYQLADTIGEKWQAAVRRVTVWKDLKRVKR
jgi:hypothetical protein